MELRYVQLVCDPSGESRFEDATVSLDPVVFAPPAPALNVATLGPASTLSVFGGGSERGGSVPHPTPCRQMI